MKLKHSNIASAVFELVKVIELDITLGEETFPTRIELFREGAQGHYFRCHVWQLELFRLQPSFPRHEDGQPAHISDDVLMVDRGIAFHKLDYDGFTAPDADSALEMIIQDLDNFLSHVTGERLKRD